MSSLYAVNDYAVRWNNEKMAGFGGHRPVLWASVVATLSSGLCSLGIKTHPQFTKV
jgi:hypothetical protein